MVSRDVRYYQEQIDLRLHIFFFLRKYTSSSGHKKPAVTILHLTGCRRLVTVPVILVFAYLDYGRATRDLVKSIFTVVEGGFIPHILQIAGAWDVGRSDTTASIGTCLHAIT